MDQFFDRATVVHQRIRRLHAEAHAVAPNDLDRLRDISDEVADLFDAMEAIREEQLACYAERDRPKRRWWHRKKATA